MSSKKILYISQEITPYLPETPISTVSRYLPQAIQETGQEIRTFMPNFGIINERRNQLHEVIRLSGMNLIIDDTDHPLIIKVASIQPARMQVYFIDNDDFFKRRATILDKKGDEFEDNDERSIFFVRGVLETIKKLRWIPDIIHCHGWMTALTSFYIKKAYADDPCYKDTKVVYSLYNDSFNSTFNNNFTTKLKFNNIDDNDIASLLKSDINYHSLSQFAMDHADGIIQGEESIDSEILKYAKNSGKKFFEYKGDVEASAEAINEFYNNL